MRSRIPTFRSPAAASRTPFESPEGARPPIEEDRIGFVESYDGATRRALVRIEQGSLHVGSLIRFQGRRNPSMTHRVQALAVQGAGVREAHAGQSAELGTPDPVERGAAVLLVRTEFPGEEY